MQKITLLFLCLFFSSALFGQYVTPGSGINWSLQEFVDNSGGVIIFQDDEYLITADVTISASDTIGIVDEAATFRVSPGVLITINGVLNITGAATPVVFTGQDDQSFFNGFRFQNSPGSVIQHTTFSRAGGIKIISAQVEFMLCKFQYFNQENSTGTIDISQSSPVIMQCEFIQNAGPAILTPANGMSSPQILYCLLEGNVTSNTNMPQINLGTSGADSIRIIGNQVTGNPLLDQVGGIAITTLAGGSIKCRVEDNLIKNNRYGMTQYGNNIGSVIRNNVIEDNNTQGLPNLGGSGINFFGNQTNHSFVSENIISGNLWGITIQNNAQPNMGQIENIELSPGMNQLFDNGNSGIIYALYNNTPLDIWAQNNYWGSYDPDIVETYIFHQPDDPTLGLVTYLPLLDPPVGTDKFANSLHNGQQIRLWPMPANQFVEIHGLPVDEKTCFELYSLNGLLVTYATMEAGMHRINISGIPAGHYLLKINSDKAGFVQKLIIYH